MRLRNSSIVAALLLTVAFSSCSTPKGIAYFQDVELGKTVMNITDATEITIRPKDELSILVNSQDSRLTSLFNLPIVSQQVGIDNSSSTSRGLSGYTVDSKGDIDFPVIGKIHVAGLTREQVAEKIKAELTAQNMVKSPIVTVKFMNLAVSVMGEVNNPGRYNIDKDKVTLLEALSMAGDLTIYGKRDSVMVLRNENGQQHVYGVNLCSANEVYTSPAYYLQQNDVVYVKPNDTKARQSTVNGNTVRSTSFWISLASLMTTIAVLIVK